VFPDVPLSFSSRHAPPTETGFGHVPSDVSREEMARQQKKVAAFEKNFPRVVTGTLGELTPVEEAAATQMEAHQRTLELLTLELALRGENPSPSEVLPKTDTIPEDDEEFKHSDDFRSIRWMGKEYSLTPQQAQIVQVMYEALVGGTPEISNVHILDRLGNPTSRLRDSFRRTDLWGDGKLIIPGKKRGLYRLNLHHPVR
jgi:hypothetical protein